MGRTIHDYLEEVKRVRDEMPSEVARIIQENKERILDLNRESQLFDKGIDSEGEQLLTYKPTTIRYKRERGEVYNRTTLLDTGDFYRGFDLLNRNNTLSIFSRDSKSSDLVEKYGNIFGLTTSNQELYNIEIILPELNAFIAKYL